MRKASENAYDYIREKVLNGTFLPAQRLVETQLAQEIGVSRNSVRKALQQLEKDRLVSIQNNKGATVIALDLHHILQYYEVRIALEQIIVRSAVENFSPLELDELEATFSTMEELCEKQDFYNYSKNNLAFHDIIYRVARKPVVAEMINAIKTQLSRYQIKTMLVPGRAEQSLREHKALLEAFRAKDVDKALDTITVHLSSVSETIEKYIKIYY
jgi:DNA-binding GntR family transcriptional regulator